MSYKRVLIKLSGEALQGENGIINFEKLEETASVLKNCADEGIETAVVVGAGNIWRGASPGHEMNRSRADKMGMLATVINAIALKDALIKLGAKAAVMSPIDMTYFAKKYTVDNAVEAMKDGCVVILGCGTGNPYFSTDTGAVLRGAELGVDIVIMAKNVDGIYDKDPHKYPDAVKYDRISYDEILQKHLSAYDLTATAFCEANAVKTYALDLKDPRGITEFLHGERKGTETYK